MEQFLVILRGAPASGKTTIAKLMRDYEKKIFGKVVGKRLRGFFTKT